MNKPKEKVLKDIRRVIRAFKKEGDPDLLVFQLEEIIENS